MLAIDCWRNFRRVVGRVSVVLTRMACLVLAAGLSPQVVSAASPCGPYRVALYEYGSLYYRDADGDFRGIDTDILDEVARRTGCLFTPYLDARARTWAQLIDGTLDMTVSGIATPEREMLARFVPYSSSRNYLIVRRELGERVMSLRAFAADPALRLGVVRGFKHGRTLDPWIDEMRAQGRVFEEVDAEVLARVFGRGRVDAFFAQPVTWGPLLRRNELEDKVRKLDVAPQDHAIGSLVLPFKRVSEENAARMRKAVEDMRADGTLEAIFARHVDPGVAASLAGRPGP